MKISNLYLALCLPGIIAPWSFLAGFFCLPEASIPFFISSIFVNPVASAVAADLMVSAIAFLVFAIIEGRRLGIRNVWMVVPATLLVGLSFGLPYFLFLRSRNRERAGERQ